jgi:hypothetical protein
MRTPALWRWIEEPDAFISIRVLQCESRDVKRYWIIRMLRHLLSETILKRRKLLRLGIANEADQPCERLDLLWILRNQVVKHLVPPRRLIGEL